MPSPSQRITKKDEYERRQRDEDVLTLTGPMQFSYTVTFLLVAARLKNESPGLSMGKWNDREGE